MRYCDDESERGSGKTGVEGGVNVLRDEAHSEGKELELALVCGI